mmetsp:Transcript_108693/g.162592  ORF Transcript_108693/g.162592 Transcript_108693/m.162592 type:complete len:229 (-) Transcript_108693:397-1083(-)
MFIPPFVGIEAIATSDLSSAASHAHTTTLAAPDFAWQKGYNWYPDTPGAYPASKWSWYYNNGGLYDQAHVITAQSDAGTAAAAGEAHTTSLYANPNAPDFVWQKNYSTWYADTPGEYPASKMTWYYQNGGLYDQAHALAPPALAQTGEISEEVKAPAKPVSASPGHYVLCGQAAILGALTATGKLLEPSQEGVLSAWEKNFKKATQEAAEALSPVGGHIMRQHILQEA